MKSKSNKNNASLFIVVIILAVAVLGVYFTNFYQQTVKNTSPTQQNRQPKTYTSNFLKFTINIPEKYIVQEKDADVALKWQGEIDIGRTGTNFSSVGEYVSDLEIKNHMTVLTKRIQTINSNSSISGFINYFDGRREKIYFVYANNWIFRISTSSETLYDDLDQIAQSFKYTP